MQPIPGDPKDNGVAAMLDDRTFCFVIQHVCHTIVCLDLQGLVAIQKFVHQCYEQKIPKVIPIEGIPFLNQSKSNQINLTQHKSNQINQMLVFEERGKPDVPREKPLGAE